jgi:hypothetical protein
MPRFLWRLHHQFICATHIEHDSGVLDFDLATPLLRIGACPSEPRNPHRSSNTKAVRQCRELVTSISEHQLRSFGEALESFSCEALVTLRKWYAKQYE